MMRRNTGFCCHAASAKRRSPFAGAMSLRPTATRSSSADGVGRGRRRHAGLDRDALREAGQRGDDLAAGEADERVRAEDGRIVPVEGGGIGSFGSFAHRGADPPSSTTACPVA